MRTRGSVFAKVPRRMAACEAWRDNYRYIFRDMKIFPQRGRPTAVQNGWTPNVSIFNGSMLVHVRFDSAKKLAFFLFGDG